MSVNITINNFTCPDLDWYFQYGEKAHFMVYYIISPCYILIALFVRILCLRAFYIKSKNESPYVYQIFITDSETVEVIAYAVYIWAFMCTVGPGAKPSWYNSCYICMVFSAHFGTTLIDSCVTLSELFTLFMSADRVYALWKPMQYKVDNHKRNQILAALFCVFIGISISVFEFFVFSVDIAKNGTHSKDDPRVYKLVPYYAHSVIMDALSFLRSAIQGIGLILLYILNGALLWLYHVCIVNVSQALNLTNEEKKHREQEKRLTLLTLCQCLWMTLNMSWFAGFYILIVLYPTFFRCSGLLYVPIFDALDEFVDLCDLATVVLINRQIRQMLFNAIPYCKTQNTVQPMPVQQAPVIFVQ